MSDSATVPGWVIKLAPIVALIIAGAAGYFTTKSVAEDAQTRSLSLATEIDKLEESFEEDMDELEDEVHGIEKEFIELRGAVEANTAQQKEFQRTIEAYIAEQRRGTITR